MPGKGKKGEKGPKHRDEQVEVVTKKCECDGTNIDINISFVINIGNKEIHVEQRAEGGGQINRNVGTNANQGGQNAIDHSKSRNDQSDFADGNGRSGIAGNDNDEAGGQQGVKVRDSIVKKSIVGSSSEQNEGMEPPEEGMVEENN
ncbi:hypothetical protein [Paucisalibacillus globulus]|uniref:hypothetical protein n=1 Tax=Paucisalibacillus globulus TaxID=351095 RepID=UPI00041572EA|nr:hypothetical protein [Paucisalibacillus globulus]